MKKFFYTRHRKEVKYGYVETLNVYKHKRDGMQRIGEVKYISSSSKGPDAEVLKLLLELKFVTKKDWDFSESFGSGPGYYIPNNSFLIHRFL